MSLARPRRGSLLSITPAEARAQRPIYEEALADNVLLWNRAPPTRIVAVHRVVTHGEIAVIWHFIHGARIREIFRGYPRASELGGGGPIQMAHVMALTRRVVKGIN